MVDIAVKTNPSETVVFTAIWSTKLSLHAFVLDIAVKTNPAETFVFTAIWSTKLSSHALFSVSL